MKIEDSIIKAYLAESPSAEYSTHWIYYEVTPGIHMFEEPSSGRIAEVRACYEQIAAMCGDFKFRNTDLVYKIFDDVPLIMEDATILLTVGLPQPYDALACAHGGIEYMVFDLIRFSDYIANGKTISDILSNLLSHELIHILINKTYPLSGDMSYFEHLDFISFHEGFAHLLSYKDKISHYQPDDSYKGKFDIAKAKLISALNESNPQRQEQYIQEADSGNYWDKYAAISSMLYLIKNIDSLKKLYEAGWKGYTKSIVNFTWV